MPSSRMMRSDEAFSSQTTGAVMAASFLMGTANAAAILSGLLRARRFGTSSPMTSEQ